MHWLVWHGQWGWPEVIKINTSEVPLIQSGHWCQVDIVNGMGCEPGMVEMKWALHTKIQAYSTLNSLNPDGADGQWHWSWDLSIQSVLYLLKVIHVSTLKWQTVKPWNSNPPTLPELTSHLKLFKSKCKRCVCVYNCVARCIHHMLSYCKLA